MKVNTSTRSNWLSWARLGWLVLLLLSLGKFSLGLPLRFAELNRICLDADKVCSQGNSLTLQEAQAVKEAGISLETYALAAIALNLITDFAWFGAGVLIFLLRPNEWMALIASAMMVVFISAGYETQIGLAYPSLKGAADLIFSLGNSLLFLFIGLFPSGRFSPRWMRWYWLGIILIGVLPIQDWLQNSEEIYNAIILLYWLSFLVLGPYSQIYRYRKESGTLERQQTKWVVLGFGAFAATILGGFASTQLLPVSDLGKVLYETVLFDLAGMLIPMGISFSILRYRLWDVNIIIRKTLVYALLTGLVGLAYYGGVVVLQGLLPVDRDQISPAVIVVTTLAIAALFNPLRRRIQDFIDRRFYRQKYNAEKALAAFAAAARSETDLSRLSSRLVGAVQETLQPDEVSLWLRGSK